MGGLSATLTVTIDVSNVPLIKGTKKADNIRAGDGDDLIYGGSGLDTLTGGNGNDKFVFDTKPAATNIDTVTDFVSGEDKLVLSSKIYSKLKGDVDLSDNIVLGQTFAAADSNDYLIWNAQNSTLYYDADGIKKGAPTPICTLSGDRKSVV